MTAEFLATGEPLTQFLVQMIIVVIFCRSLSYLIKYIRGTMYEECYFVMVVEPSVIAEVVTGIILGPSVLGISMFVITYCRRSYSKLYGHYISCIFHQYVQRDRQCRIDCLYVHGMRMHHSNVLKVGLEIDTRLVKKNLGHAFGISVTAMVAPFSLVSIPFPFSE